MSLLEENIDEAFKESLNRIIADLEFIQELMSNETKLSKYMRSKYKKSLETLKYLGVEI